MKPKFIVNILIIIVALISIKGFLCIKQIDSKFGAESENLKNSALCIEKVYNWYLTSVCNNLVKYSNSISSFKEFEAILNETKKTKQESFADYYSFEPSSNEEFLLSDTLRKQDVEINSFLNRVLKMDKRASSQTIAEMYQVVSPAMEAAEKIIEIKNNLKIESEKQLHSLIVDFEMFLLLAGAFSAAMMIAYNAPKIQEQSVKETVKPTVKKRKPKIKTIKLSKADLNS